MAASPWWQLTSVSRPGYLPSQAGETGEVAVIAENLGDADVDGESSPVTIADTLPEGLEAVGIAGSESEHGADPQEFGALPCSLAKLSCSLEGALPPFGELEVRIAVRVKPGAHAGELNRASATGGGAPAASLARALVFSEQPTPFGIEDFSTRFEEEGGGLDTKAGSHPFQMTTTVSLNQGPDKTTVENQFHKPSVEPVGMAKDVFTKFPAGFIGDPTPIPTCSLSQFLVFKVGSGANPEENGCSAQSAVGVASVTIFEPAFLRYSIITVPLFAVETYFGEPARFGFAIPLGNVPVLLDASLRSGPGEGVVPGVSEDYGIDVDSTNITQGAGLISARVTVWGTPGDPRHDNSRGWSCLAESRLTNHGACNSPEEQHPPAFLTTPTSCAGPLQASVEVDSWTQPGVFGDYQSSEQTPPLKGCNQLPFDSTIQSGPTTNSASSPSGLDFNVNFKNEGLTNEEGLAQSQLNATAVTLPEGFTINPSAGVGLVGCTPADYARETIESAPGAGCPNESKLGTVEIETPVLTQKIHGNIYIAQPHENPFGSLVALYLVAKNPETGVLIKLAGKVTPNPLTGQLVTTFENNPPLPFSHFNFHFREGQQAPLITPPTCGTYETKAELTPWSEPLAPVIDTSAFTITSGVGGGPCPTGGVPPFHPGIQSGTLNNNAGAFSPFYLHLTRGDADQEIAGFSTNLPPGLTGDLTGIPYCPEADIEAARRETGAQEEANPSCPASSQVGHTLVGTGVGAVLAYVPGKIYLAGPYNGKGACAADTPGCAPFSLVSITSAKVGPFDLGTVVLRFGLNIDPSTAQVSVSPTTSEPIPTIIDGIVTHVRDIRVYIDRPNFIINPTSCAPMAIGSTLTAHEGASATISSPFQTASCANLKFAPKFRVFSKPAKDTRLDGVSLTAKLSEPNAPQGTQANIARVKVELPRALPSRLTTLRKACTGQQFEANPAGCPPASRIGMAVVHTPILPVALEGPAIFVSHGGEAFPSLTMVLQGDGVTVDVVGTTFISKAGVTSTTFKTVPDTPFSTFELTLPEGEFSALTALGNLCKQKKLVMPTEFTAQNGAQIAAKTKVEVQGCGKARRARPKRARGRGHRTKRKG
ncbi:MAG TPA: hypothetical protein VNV42_01815 [Solirubrobacteraceae bacterium]|nr:hypothetical protein [Solirubrobacteraceae bacterium]